MIKKAFIGFLMIAVFGMGAYGQMGLTGLTEDFKFIISGEMGGMITAGFQDEKQAANNAGGEAPGAFYPNLQTGRDASVGTGKNGYYNNFDLVFFLSPISFVEMYAKFKTRYQPGSPYMPFQTDSASEDTYSIKVDSAWARVDAVGGLGFNIPLNIWLKLGKFKAEASQFNKVSRFGVEGVLDPLQTGTNHSMQLEAVYHLPNTGSLALSFTTHLKLNNALKEYYDVDSEENSVLNHYTETGLFAKLPIHLSLKLLNLDLSFMTLQAELLYALNGLHIASGHNFGAGIGAKINVLDNLSIPIGLGFAFTEKNIDPFTSSAIEKSDYEPFYVGNGYSKADSYTVGLRQSLRIGFGAGVEFAYEDIVKMEFNLGFAYSQIAHIYRDSLNLFSLSIDLRTVFLGKYIVGGGVVLGSLTDAEWKVKNGINKRRPGESVDRELFEGHTFSLAENLGFEVYGGLLMSKARFILGYNINKGLSMSRYLEALPDAQLKYRQADTSSSDGLFQRGGLFIKLIINL